MITAAASCALCGLPIPGAPLEQAFSRERLPFCCPGCLNVYAILHESGVVARGTDLRSTDLFKESLARGLVASGDAADAARRAVTVPDDAPTADAMFHVGGLWCGSCAWLIERALACEPGIRRAEVIFTSDLLKVTWCPQYVTPQRVPSVLATFGYRATPWTGETDAGAEERRALALRFGLSVFLWLNLMMLNLALYVGYFQETPGSIRQVVPWVLMALSAPVVFYGGWPVLRLAAGALRHGMMRMETLLALGILSAWGYSAIETVRGGPHIYFDTASAIVVFVLAGKSIERAARERTGRAIRQLHRLMPRKARLLVDAAQRFVPIEALLPGQLILVRAGERIPCDGVVTSGHSHVDESLLTGEAKPCGKTPGSEVAGGSLNIDTPLEIRASRTGEDSALAHAVRMVEAALAGRSRLERAVDRVSRMFVPTVVLLATATCAAWWAGRDVPFGDALLRGITVLVIACPCALGIATPLALTAAVGAASRRGILVGHSAALETIRHLDVVVFDKTGTVTVSDFAVVEVAPEHLPALVALERYSEHPLGRAVARAAEREGAVPLPAADVRVEKGAGVIGTVAGRPLAIGSRRMFSRIEPRVDAAAAAHVARGNTVAFYGEPACASGLVAFGNTLRPEAEDVVQALHARGIRTVLLSGDAAETVAHIAADLRVAEYRAEQLPGDKLRAIGELKASGRIVAMVGDGINDAPALAEADLGIAVSSGTDLAMKAAAVVLVHRDLHGLLDAIDLAERTFRIVRQNLFWAFVYNTAGLALAVAGALHPIAAAAGMVLSSVSVVGNSYRLAAADGPAVGTASRG